MFQRHFRVAYQGIQPASTVLLAGIVLSNMAFNILANVCFKYSAHSPNLQQFLKWQIIGNLAGFATVLTLTWLLRFIPLYVAFPLTTGLAVIGVSVVGGALFFNETISATQWLGVLAITVGIVMVAR